MEKKILALLKKGEPVVVATILSNVGSTPRTAGTKMAVRKDGTGIGTIGGGLVEAEVMESAAEVFRTGRSRVIYYSLEAPAVVESMDMICGGNLEIYVDLIRPTGMDIEILEKMEKNRNRGRKGLLITALSGDLDEEQQQQRRLLLGDDDSVTGDSSLKSLITESVIKKVIKQRAPVVLKISGERFLLEPCVNSGTVFIFGAGHVSQKVAVMAKLVDFRTVVMDDRAEFANRERFPEADEVRVLSDFSLSFSDLVIDKDSYLVIVTRGHSHDKTVLAGALGTKAGYIGMIGSKRKREAVYKALLGEGFTQEDLERVYSPIGLSIGAQTPSEIAVSIVAELIQKRAE